MNLDKMPVNWFDFLVVLVILLGASRGRRNGLSQELVVCLQWAAIVCLGAFFYLPAGNLLADTSPMSHLFCFIVAYIAIAMVVKAVFSVIKKGAGGKLVGSDVFGAGEFYLGMVAGAIRFTCVLIAGLALLNARLYSTQEVSRALAFQKDVYGSNFFPELSSVQAGVFKESLIGPYFKEYGPFLLIRPTAPEHKAIKRRKDDLP